jgi:hypothetical protein
METRNKTPILLDADAAAAAATATAVVMYVE